MRTETKKGKSAALASALSPRPLLAPFLEKRAKKLSSFSCFPFRHALQLNRSPLSSILPRDAALPRNVPEPAGLGLGGVLALGKQAHQHGHESGGVAFFIGVNVLLFSVAPQRPRHPHCAFSLSVDPVTAKNSSCERAWNDAWRSRSKRDRCASFDSTKKNLAASSFFCGQLQSYLSLSFSLC